MDPLQPNDEIEEQELEESEMEEVVGEGTEKRYVCDVCFVGNLTHNVNVKRCNQCNEIHCMHFTSKIDPQYCIHCLHDVQVTVESVSKIQVTYDENKDEVKTKVRKAKRIRFTGMHWLFAQRKIDEYNDVELELAQEYHRAIYNALIYEREQRHIANLQKKYKKNNSVVGLPVVGAAPGAIVTEKTTVRKSKTIQSAKPAAPEINLKSVLDSLLSKGLTVDQIAKMMMKK